jgi:molecular chaperone HscB
MNKIPNTENYFAFYNLDVDLNLDEQLLRNTYLQYTKQFHPDFFTLNKEEHDLALKISSYNNDAYRVLSHFERRVAYFLKLKDMLKEGEKAQFAANFLMDVMDYNEALEAAIAAGNPEALLDLKKSFTERKETYISAISMLAHKWSYDKTNTAYLIDMKNQFQELSYFNNLLSKLS